MNFACPNCGMENAYFEILDSKGAHYTCPDCGYEWVDRSVKAEEEDDEDDEVAESDDEADDLLSQARILIYNATGDFLGELIKDFELYQISEEDLITLAKLYKLVRKPRKYTASGYLYIIIKEVFSEGNHQFQEIKVDEDGLQLTYGGYETGPYGGDSISNSIFPVYDEMEALDLEPKLEEFFDSFRSRLEDTEVEVEIFDSGDEIEEMS